MTTLHVISPAKVNVPRAAPYAAQWFVAVLNWLQQAGGAYTARRQTAERAADAARLRSYAQQVAQHDPRTAADLLAAADRHEQVG